MSYLNLETGNMSSLQRNLLRLLMIFLLISCIFILIFGGANGAERIFGLLILVALAIINAPAFFTKGKVRAIPVELLPFFHLLFDHYISIWQLFY